MKSLAKSHNKNLEQGNDVFHSIQQVNPTLSILENKYTYSRNTANRTTPDISLIFCLSEHMLNSFNIWNHGEFPDTHCGHLVIFLSYSRDYQLSICYCKYIVDILSLRVKLRSEAGYIFVPFWTFIDRSINHQMNAP